MAVAVYVCLALLLINIGEVLVMVTQSCKSVEGLKHGGMLEHSLDWQMGTVLQNITAHDCCRVKGILSYFQRFAIC